MVALRGTGDHSRAENFTCVGAPKAKYTPLAPEYLVKRGL